MSRLRGGSILEQKGVGLPREYQEVEYLESTGTQYIDTGIYTGPDKTGVELKAKYIEVERDCILFGSASSWLSSAFEISKDTNYGDVGRIRFVIKNKCNITDIVFETNVIYEFSMFNKEQKINDRIFSYDNVSPEYMFKLYLFVHNRSGRINTDVSKMQMYNCKLYKHGDTKETSDLVRNFIPCYRISDSKPGMYDLVSDSFFTNQGTDEFILGPDVY